MNLCPCCSNILVRQACLGRVYWFCSHCYQEMPSLEALVKAKSKTVPHPTVMMVNQ